MAKSEPYEALEVLIDELTKDRPNQARVRKLMQENGLVYTTDSIQQMSSVLVLMSKLTPETRKHKLKEKVSEI